MVCLALAGVVEPGHFMMDVDYRGARAHHTSLESMPVLHLLGDTDAVNLYNPLTDNTILDRSKFKQIEDDILKCI